MFDKLFRSHEIAAMFLTVALSVGVSMMFSKKPFSRGLALWSWACTAFLGAMLVIRIAIYILGIFGLCC